ncbi:MAG: hypothetical protein ACK5IQ_09935 [Bacteroidales bacterium]
MSTIRIFTIVALITVFYSCGAGARSSTKGDAGVQHAATPSDYTVFENFFPKNDIETGTVMVLISNKEDFDKYLGVGKTMTNLIVHPDFSKEVVAVICLPTTNKSTTLSVSDIKRDKGSILLNISQEVGEERSYSIRPSLVLGLPMSGLTSVDFKIDGGESKTVNIPAN